MHSSLKLIKKHRPFASVNNLPKICQPEDNHDINFPRSSSSELSSDQPSEDDSQLEDGLLALHKDDPKHKLGELSDWVRKKPRIGPSFKLQSLNQMLLQEGLALEDKVVEPRPTGFEKQVNVFNLKDTLTNPHTSYPDKLEALAKLKKQATLPAFKVAVEAILLQLTAIKDVHIQVEIVNTVAKSRQYDLATPLS